MYERTSEQTSFRVDVGRAQVTRTGEFATFVRVIHLPSGRSRIEFNLKGCSSKTVADELASELLREVD